MNLTYYYIFSTWKIVENRFVKLTNEYVDKFIWTEQKVETDSLIQQQQNIAKIFTRQVLLL